MNSLPLLSNDDLPLLSNDDLLFKLRTYYPYQEFNSNDDVLNCLMDVISSHKDIFSRCLKQVRINLGLSQKQLAEAMEVQLVTYSTWERGIATPRLSILVRALELNKTSIRAQDLIAVNPVTISTTRQIPLLSPEHFRGSDLEMLMRKVNSSEQFEKYAVSDSENCDFAFRVSDDDMISYGKTIPSNSIALCSCSELLGKNFLEKLEMISGKISLVSFNHGKATIRETNFIDKQFLQLKAWNESIDEKNFPLDTENAKYLKDPKSAEICGFPTSALSVGIFAIVKKVIQEF